LQQLSTLTLPLLLEKIMYESGLLEYNVHSKDHVWNVQVLHTFFSFVRESFERNPRLSLTELLTMIDRMKDEAIALLLQKSIQQEKGVQFFTAHSSKGNEFEQVFLIGCTKNFWEAKSGRTNSYFLPDTITNTREDNDHEQEDNKEVVARRLFYVAMTRAKQFLHISFAQKDNKGKDLSPSVFIDEISTRDERIQSYLSEEDLVQHLEWAMKPVPDVSIDIANRQYISQSLAGFNMSYSSLSNYLNCPLSFYFEKVLKVPFLKNDSMAFGSAVHFALEKWFKDMKENKGVFPPKEELLKAFEIGMYKEREAFTTLQYERRLEQGHSILTDYYDRYLNELPTDVLIELNIPRFLLDGIPVTGKVDKIELGANGCMVVDYKTGKSDKAKEHTLPPNENNPQGGDYWRQMVFYKILLENKDGERYRVNNGMFDYLEKDKTSGEYKRIYVPMTQADETAVRAQLKETYASIMNHEFTKGCGDEKCRWCNFAKKYEMVN
jgi:DNA helicase-2/ATP-dependent DNA helicase PcrA